MAFSMFRHAVFEWIAARGIPAVEIRMIAWRRYDGTSNLNGKIRPNSLPDLAGSSMLLQGGWGLGRHRSDQEC